MAAETLNIRRLVLDVDKAVAKPTVTELAEAFCGVAGVEAVNITVTEIDIETVGFNVTIEGERISYPDLVTEHTARQRPVPRHRLSIA